MGHLSEILFTGEYESASTIFGNPLVWTSEIVQCLANQQSSNESQIQSCCSAAACIVQYIILNVHTVCDVIIARSCGSLPPFAAILFVLDCVVEL